MTSCKSCGAKIEFFSTKNGKLIPVEPVIQKGGNIWLGHDEDWKPFVKVSKDDPGGNYVGPFKSHFVSCPGAAAHRKRGER
jgi:hypothetical protein